MTSLHVFVRRKWREKKGENARFMTAPITEGNDVLVWLAGALVRHALVGVLGRRMNDMGSSEENDAIVIFVKPEVEGTGSLKVGRLEWGNGEAKRGREGLAEVVDVVGEGVGGDELRAGHRPGHLRLTESDLDIWEAGQT